MQKFTQLTVEQALISLMNHGYKASICEKIKETQRIIVQDPVYGLGTGGSAGRLVFICNEPKILRNPKQVFKFIDDRS